MSFLKELLKDVIISFVLTVTTIVGMCTAGLIWEKIENKIKNK